MPIIPAFVAGAKREGRGEIKERETPVSPFPFPSGAVHTGYKYTGPRTNYELHWLITLAFKRQKLRVPYFLCSITRASGG